MKRPLLLAVVSVPGGFATGISLLSWLFRQVKPVYPFKHLAPNVAYLLQYGFIITLAQLLLKLVHLLAAIGDNLTHL